MSRIGTSSDAAALAIREPSTCTLMPCAWAWSQIARISSGVYSVPSSVLWVMETTCGIARCSSSQPQACRSISSGVSLPSGVGTVSSLSPPIRSGAPHSSTLMCALSAHTTAPHRSVTACSATTFAPVPLKTGNASAVGAEVAADDALQVLGVRVVTVRDLVPAVGQRQGGEHLGVNARVVVTGETANVRVVTAPGVGLGRGHDFLRSVSRLTGLPSSSQWAATFLLGCTRGGSPGIFG